MRWATCAAACAAAILTASVLSAQAPAPSANRAVVIGCLSQQQVNGQTRYVLTDSRGNPPTSFILDGDPAAINWHVGHSLEVVGTLSAAGTNTYNLKVTSVIYIANSCSKK